jgi:hypothetical protein
MALSAMMCFNMNAEISQSVVQQTIRSLSAKDANNRVGIEKGVSQAASLWQTADGTEQDFQKFCEKNYIADPKEKEQVFLKISDYLEGINGYYNQMTLRLQHNVHLTTGTLYPIDEMFAAYSPSAHMTDDFYMNKIAFVVMLNFPHLTLAEKEALGNDRKAWAYARLGDMFTDRIPAEVLQKQSNASSDAEMYISAYNIYMGYTTNKEGKVLFPKELVLLSHWNLRDEIKSNYNKGKVGLDKQRSIYEIMKRIISQEIPVEVINKNKYIWNPFANTITLDGKTVQGTPESTTRYQKLLNDFNAQRGIDKYTKDTYIDRKFNDEMEISLKDAETLFDSFLSAPELKAVAKMISKRLGRKLEAYDIWYDGFKPRSNMDETKLNEQTRALYPNAEAMKKDLPNILMKAGFTKEKANYIAEKVAVDPARGSGHAWGTAMKGQQSHLRTRIPATGMDYKGYNIAVHEFGHNVEQTISMYDVDYYMMNGVPNTAFTEALAFVFQKRDLEFLGIKDNDPEKKAMDVLDKVWSMYEITGVSMVDISVWKWLYAHPDATAEQLKEATIGIAKEVWNKYYAPVFGLKDETILAVYSHMIDTPLYLSAYAFGQIIEYQLDQYLEGKDFATEVERIFSQGRLTPNVWMKQATGSPLTVEPMLEAVRKVIKN